MKILILAAITSIFTILASSCERLFPDEELSLKRTDYTGNELRTDGYYYLYNYNGNTHLVVIYFLYRNGVVYHAYTSDAGVNGDKSIDIVENEMIEHISKYYNENKKRKYRWGLFMAKNNKIYLEQWVESPNGVNLSIYRLSGYIESDTVIRFTESYYSGRDETKKEDDVYHFKKFDNKPDSTNTFIK